MGHVEELFDEIRKATAAGLYYLALFGALVLPDICGALASDGRATGSKYKDWLRQHVPEHAQRADQIYGLRCSLLHQGRALPHGGFSPIMFTLPGGGQVHNLSVGVNPHGLGSAIGPVGSFTEGPDMRVTDVYGVETFIDEVIGGAQRWFEQFGRTTTVVRNLEKFARYRPEGLAPHVTGTQVIG
jgi:hypothetical protein